MVTIALKKEFVLPAFHTASFVMLSLPKHKAPLKHRDISFDKLRMTLLGLRMTLLGLGMTLFWLLITVI